MISDFKQTFTNYPKVSSVDILNFFLAIDGGYNGTVDYDELMKAWLQVRKKN